MNVEPSPWSSPIFLLTNDDGIDGPGLTALAEAARDLGVAHVVAPIGPQSGCGHAVTTHRAIAVERRPDGRLAVDGTPGDCVRLGLHHLVEGCGWVLSGINPGGNLGVDVYHSGTVAAAREAAIQGRPGIAISHYLARGRAVDWEVAATRARRTLVGLLAQPWEPGTFWNVNLPHPEPGGLEPEIVRCPVDPSPLPLDFRVDADGATYRGNYQERARVAGSDVAVCFGGAIAVSLIRVA